MKTRRACVLMGIALVGPAGLAGCSGGPRVVHHGYAADGYGVIDNSPHLPPPTHLLHSETAGDTPPAKSSAP